MKAQIYEQTKLDLKELCAVLSGPERPTNFENITVYPSNIIRMALQDFYSHASGSIQSGSALLRHLSGETIKDPNDFLYLIKVKSSKIVPKANTPYRMRHTAEHKFMASCSSGCGMNLVDALSHITNITVKRLKKGCSMNDWERFQTMNNTYSSLSTTPRIRLAGGFRSKLLPVKILDPLTSELKSYIPSGLCKKEDSDV